MSEAWATGNEIHWINTIGQTHAQTKEMPSAVLLRHYVEAADKRRDWGDMSREQVLKHAYRLLLGAALEEERNSA